MASDDFNRPDADLDDGDWLQPTAFSPLKIVDGAVEVGTLNTDSAAVSTVSTVQASYVRVVDVAGGQNGGPAVLNAAGEGAVLLNHDLSNFYIYTVPGYSVVGFDSGLTYVPNDIIGLRRVGGGWVGSQNGIDVLTSDPVGAPAGLRPGLFIYNGLVLDDWTDGAAPSGPTITDQPDNVTVNEPNEATFTVAATGAGTLTYQWQVDDGGGWDDISGETAATLSIDPTSEALSGYQYRCNVTDDDGTTASSAATLTVNPPAAVFDLSDPVFTFKKNNGELLAEAGVTLWASDLISGEMLALLTDLVTDADGLLGVVPAPPLDHGTEYRVNYEFDTGEYGVAKLSTEA